MTEVGANCWDERQHQERPAAQSPLKSLKTFWIRLDGRSIK